ncbi:MAG: hypothetical protein IPJ27_09010 [Candidatus Accumulibacter sp.]|uniref:Uncharacterized protein n=1 Tax=Candidatus Accumulibacter proximus TaxID=2954385 RepID=A0A935UGW9_9PROT|nr:hypothetical protein [Candidatus Accumulibacter proximus]
MTHHPGPGDTPPGTPQADTAELWRQLRASPRQASVWLELARDYRRHAARQALRCDAAVRAQLDALDLGPWQDPAAGDAQLGRPTLPQASALVEQFSARASACPGDWLTWLCLAPLHELQALVTQDLTPPKPKAASAVHAHALARKTYQEIVQSRLAASEPGTVVLGRKADSKVCHALRKSFPSASFGSG